jgi:hypothetical protein
MQVEHRLTRARAHIDDDTVIGQARSCSDFGDEVEHPLVLGGRELGDVVEAVDVPLRDDEEVRRRLRVDVADGDEPVGLGDVVALPVEPAEEAVVRQRGSPPR